MTGNMVNTCKPNHVNEIVIFPPVFILFECVYLTLLNQVKLKKCRKYSIKLLYIGCCKVFVFVNPNFDI